MTDQTNWITPEMVDERRMETPPDVLRSLIHNFVDVADLIYNISPVKTPFMSKPWDFARVQKRKTGGSMRQRRRAMMKPLRFTPCDKARKVYEWRRDA